MENNSIPFMELMESVLNLLKSKKYMDSTLTVYKQTYNRIHIFLKQHDTDIYTHELGEKFLTSQEVSKRTLVAYSCAVRRLDDYIDKKSYRSHHGNAKDEVPAVFSTVLSEYLQKCESDGNKPATILFKEKTCVIFLKYLEKDGLADLSNLNTNMITRSLLHFTNKDSYACIRQFLKYLADKGIMKMDLSGIIPRFKRSIPLPTTYTPDEISDVENSIDVSTDIGKRNLAMIRLASRMGFRAGDIARLKLLEINFDTGYINIIQEKTGIPLSLQMPPEVSDALVTHLNNDKYSIDDGYVFHSMVAPYERITTNIIRHALNECFFAAGVNTTGKKHGSHAFRSSLATSMVNDGVSYDVVRRILGHTDPDVIKHYAKADIENLRLCSIKPPAPTGRFLDYLSGREVISHV